MKPLKETDKKEAEEFEYCILCNKLTKYRRNDHIDFRDFYIEGAGQCCEECYMKTYGCN